MALTIVPSEPPAALLGVKETAALLKCSERHLYRLVDSGRAPAPIKLGALVRFSRKSIEDWIADGCPPCRRGGS